jgi:hypothetical protein
MNRSMKKYSNYTILALLAVALTGLWQACSEEDGTTGNPQVKSFTPEAGGPAGTYVIISGNFFSTKAENNVVTFNGTPATVISSTANSIITTVPAGASTGPISVSVKGHEGSTPSSFTVSSGAPAPVILGMTPATGLGSEGTDVTVTGLNFSTTAANNVVTFKGGDGAGDDVTATVTEATATSLKFKVPAGARSGKIVVAVNGVTLQATSPSDFAVPAPSISGFTPTSSIIGSTVVISGSNFSKTSAKNIVKFGGTTATSVSVNGDANKLTVIVPAGATTGDVTVTVDGQTGNGGEFNLPHTITSFTPVVGPVGTEVVITGTNFSKSADNIVVKFNGVTAAKPTDVSYTSLTVKVPSGATTGKISITINGLTVESLVNFTVN